MPAKESMEWSYHKGKFLTTIGLALLVYGLLRYYGYDFNLTLAAVGAVLFLKGLWHKLQAHKWK